MHILRLRSFTILVTAIFALCLLNLKNVSAHEGWGIVVDRQGQIYFSDIPTNTIWRIAGEGKLEAFLKNKHSHALVLAEDGSIYGTQEHHAAAVGSVWRIGPDGSFSDVLIPPPDFPLNLHPFTIDREGNIYSTNSISFPDQGDKTMLLRADRAGLVTVLAGGIRGYRDGRGEVAQFSGIDGMAWATDGSLYLTDGVYVRRLETNGTVTTVGNVGLTSQSFGEDLMGLIVSAGGVVHVADYSQRRVLKLTPDGNTQTILETGLFWSPTGVSKAGEDLYVLEHLRMPLVVLGDIGVGPYARVQKVSPDGTVNSVATVWGRNSLASAAVSLAALVALIFLIRLFRRRKFLRRFHQTTAA